MDEITGSDPVQTLLQRMVPERELPGGICVDRDHPASVSPQKFG